MVTRAPYRGESAVYRAAAQDSCGVGLCLRNVREWYGIPARYVSAYSAWRNCDPDRRHQTYPPPRGYPVFWSGGSQSYGHIALSLGGGLVRSTDWPSAGRVGNARIQDISAKWYMTYLGWTYDLNGMSVWSPTIDASAMYWIATHSPHRGSKTTAPMIKAVEDSLNGRGYLPTFRVNGTWNSHTAAAYEKWQDRINYKVDGTPSVGDLRRLGRLAPFFVVRP